MCQQDVIVLLCCQ